MDVQTERIDVQMNGLRTRWPRSTTAVTPHAQMRATRIVAAESQWNPTSMNIPALAHEVRLDCSVEHRASSPAENLTLKRREAFTPRRQLTLKIDSAVMNPWGSLLGRYALVVFVPVAIVCRRSAHR